MMDVERPVETPAALYKARKALEMTQAELAEALRLKNNGERTVRRWEKGEVEISGPAQIAIEWLLQQHFGPELDLPERDEDSFDGEDHTAHRAFYASVLDNADRPEVVRALVERWFESERQMLQALVVDRNRLNVEQYQLVMRAVGA